MTRTKFDQSISSAGWRRLLRIALVLPAVFDFYLYQGGTRWFPSPNNSMGIIIPKAHAAASDPTIHLSHPTRHQQNHHDIRSNRHESCTDPCFRTVDRSVNSGIEDKPEHISERRQKDIRPLKIFGRNPLRVFVTSKREKRDYLRETTRLVGGANPDTGVDQETLGGANLNTDVDQYPPGSIQNPLDLGLEDMPMVPPRNQNQESREMLRKRFQRTLMLTHNVASQAGPALITLLALLYFHNGKKDEISLLTLYTLALLGASCGFHLFLHFITLGYALGVTLPLIVALHFYQNKYELSLPTILHSSLTIIWGVRLFAFLAIREYVTWPSLHQKVVEVQSKMKIPFASKILCWFLYSFFYVGLVSSCWSRLLQGSTSKGNWGILGYTGLSLQFVGLLLETVADVQKNSFKTRNKLAWCNSGVWKYSTHPNYLGEGLFWWGTYLAHGFDNLVPSLLATMGLMTILYVLKGSAKSLSSKQKEKYGQDVDFYQFQRTHNVFGPKQIWSRRQTLEAVGADTLATEAMTNNYDIAVNGQEVNQ